MLYRISNGTLSVGGKTILENFDFEIKGRDHIALVGENGAGKTTFLRYLAGELSLDRDDKRKHTPVYQDRQISVGFVKQIDGLFAITDCDCRPGYENDSDKDLLTQGLTLKENLMQECPSAEEWSRERAEYELEFDRLFTGLGFKEEDKEKTLDHFSGGERTKIALIKTLIKKPDLLLLDEPTNHLDAETVRWLEMYLKKYHGMMVIVSHDRFFLDETADIVYELSGKKLGRYTGNYTSYREQKEKELVRTEKAWERQQEEIRREEQLISRFRSKARKASFARSRKKILARMDMVDRLGKGESHLFTGDISPLSAGPKWVMELDEVKAGYDIPLFEISLRVKRGQKIGIIGPNGVGKSTLIKTAAGVITPLKGRISYGKGLHTEYFDQHSAGIISDRTVLEHYMGEFPALC